MVYGAVERVAGLMRIVLGLVIAMMAGLFGFMTVTGVTNIDVKTPPGIGGNTWLGVIVSAILAVLFAIISWQAFRSAWRTWHPATGADERGAGRKRGVALRPPRKRRSPGRSGSRP